MASDLAARHRQVPCQRCPLRGRPGFRDFSDAELAFIRGFKRGELVIERGVTVLEEGVQNPHMYTVLSGWGFRYKALSDGRRQIVNFAMPSDVVGLQGTLLGAMQHSVEALSPMVLCVFERGRLFSMFEACPDLSFDLTWIASREECILDENLLAVGRRTAVEKVAYLMVFLLHRSVASGLLPEGAVDVPISQQHVADALGLSLVHTNKTVRKLCERGLLAWVDGGCRILDLEGLGVLAEWSEPAARGRPFL